MLFNGLLKNILFRRTNYLNNKAILLSSYKTFCTSNVKAVSDIENTIKMEIERDQEFIEKLNLTDSIKKLKQKNIENAKEKNSIDNSSGDIVYVNGIPPHWNETKLLKYFDKYLTKIRNIKLITNSFGKQTKNALINFEKPNHAEEFVDKFDEDWINTEDEQYHLKCRIFQLRTNRNKLNIIDRTRQVMVYNLAWETKEVDMMNIAKEFGEIEDFQMPFISKNKNKGYCIITFKKENFANAFVESTEGMSLFGRGLKFKQKYFVINSNKDQHTDNYYDKVITNAETPEIFIRGALQKFGLEYFLNKENILYSKLANEINPAQLVGPNQYYYVKKNECFKEMNRWRKNKVVRAMQIKRDGYKRKQLNKLIVDNNE